MRDIISEQRNDATMAIAATMLMCGVGAKEPRRQDTSDGGTFNTLLLAAMRRYNERVKIARQRGHGLAFCPVVPPQA